MKRLFPLLLALGLGGCYQSVTPFFFDAEGVQPIAAGRYAAQPKGKEVYVVEQRGSGGYTIRQGKSSYNVILVPAARPDDYYAQAIDGERSYYGLLSVRDGQIGLVQPKCDDAFFQRLANVAGATYYDPGEENGPVMPVCTFVTRNGLKQALDASTEAAAMKLYPVKNEKSRAGRKPARPVSR